eukprot:5934517-Prymnesium_polylepis.2
MRRCRPRTSFRSSTAESGSVVQSMQPGLGLSLRRDGACCASPHATRGCHIIWRPSPQRLEPQAATRTDAHGGQVESLDEWTMRPPPRFRGIARTSHSKPLPRPGCDKRCTARRDS